MKILASTDFSDTAHNALLNAVKLASCYGAELIFLHAMSKPIVPATSPEEVYSGLFNAERDQSIKRLQEVSRLLYQEAGLRPTEILKQLVVEPTPLADAILHLIAKYNVDLVVMGASGNNGLKRLFMGSNTLELIEVTPVPLLVIPKGYHFSGFKNITVVVEHDQVTERAGFRILERFIHTFSSALYLVWIPEEDEPVPDLKHALFSDNSTETLQETPYQLKVIPKESAKEELKQHLKSTETDLLVRLPKRNALWSDSLNGSETVETANKFKIPLLVIPQKLTSY